MRLGRPRPLLQPLPLPRQTLRDATGLRLPAPGPRAERPGSQPGAPGGSQAAPSPAPARRSRGRSSRLRPKGRSTGCTARSWWGRASGAGPMWGAAAGGAGARGATGLGTGCACLSAARLPHRLGGGGAGRRGGETPPSSRSWEGRGPLFLPPPALRSPPLAPRAPAPQGCLEPGDAGQKTRLGGPSRWGTGGSGMSWGCLGPGVEGVPGSPNSPYLPSLTRSRQRL